MTQMNAIDKAVKATNARQKDNKQEVDQLTKSQTFISEQYDTIKIAESKFSKTNKSLEAENALLNNKVSELLQKVNTNTITAINQQQYTRRIMVEINNVPRKDKEDSKDIAYKLIDLMELNLTKETIDVAHRLSDRADSPIIVKFTTRTARDIFYQGRAKLPDYTAENLGLQNDPNKKNNKIFINESLTQPIKILFKSARAECEKKSYKFTWTRNGVIYVRKNKDSNSICIKLDDDYKRNIR